MKIREKKEDLITIFILGLVLTILPISSFIYDYKKIKSMDKFVFSTKTEYSISKHNRGRILYNPKYTYKVNDKTYICKPHFTLGLKIPDKTKKIYYKENSPQICFVEKENIDNIACYLSLIIGILLLFITFVSIKEK